MLSLTEQAQSLVIHGQQGKCAPVLIHDLHGRVRLKGIYDDTACACGPDAMILTQLNLAKFQSLIPAGRRGTPQMQVYVCPEHISRAERKES